jgi:carbonic anhydrase
MGMDELLKKHKEFKDIHFQEHKELFLELVEKGQHPKTLFIGCSDSRVVPDLITGAKPGELFVFRNIGNFVPPFKPNEGYYATAAAIEYGVSVLGVEDIIICGHSYCGACESLYKDIPDTLEFIHTKKWLELGKRAKEVALKCCKDDKEKLLRATEKISIVFQLENLLTYPMVKRRVDEGLLRIHGWYYKIETGEIEAYDAKKNSFFIIEP